MERDDLELKSASRLVVDWLGRLRLGTPFSSGALAVVPVFGGATCDPVSYRTLPEAIEAGEVIIQEYATPTVPGLQVLNQGKLPVLILDGEEVAGGRQNRVVNTTLLVPASATFDLPVTCVEHGRWNEIQTKFDPGETVYPSLRRQKAEQVTASFRAAATPVADQAAVWAEVEARHRSTGTHSATAAVRDAYVHLADNLSAAERGLPFPDDNPTGVIAFVEGHAICADLFDRTETLRRYWQRLMRSYALEAIGPSADTEPQLDSARRLLARPANATRTPFASPGRGIDVRILGNGVVGAALVVQASLLHVALFRQRRRPARQPFASPRERACHLQR
jgi:hypothetical protein